MPSKPSPTDILWSDRDVAAYLGVAPVTVRRRRYEGALPTVKIGAAVRVPRRPCSPTWPLAPRAVRHDR